LPDMELRKAAAKWLVEAVSDYEERVGRRITYAWLADEADVHRATLSKIKNRRTDPDAITLSAIHRVLQGKAPPRLTIGPPATVDVRVPTPTLSRGAMPPAAVMAELDRITGKVREVLQSLAELRALIPATGALSGDDVAALTGRTAQQVADAEQETRKVAGGE
jgi:transcriptional regulator with XRE-family HTH domain